MGRRSRLTFLFLLGPWLLMGAQLVQAEIVDGIIAKVNQDLISLSEFKEALDPVKERLAKKYSGKEYTSNFETLKIEILRQMVQQLLLEQEAKKSKIPIDEAQVKGTLENIKKDYDYKSEAEFLEALRKQGLTLDEYKERIRNQFRVMHLRGKEVDSRVTLLDAELKQYYDNYKDEFRVPGKIRLKQMILAPEGGKIEARNMAEKIYQSLQDGADWDVAVKEHSAGPARDKGGETGWFQEGDLQPQFNDPIFRLQEPGQITPLLETPNGWVVFKAVEVEGSSLKPFEEVKNRIEQVLFEEKAQKKLEQWLRQIYDRSYIDIKWERITSNPPDELFPNRKDQL